MKAMVLNVVGRGFALENVELAAPRGCEVLVEVRASGLCRTDLLLPRARSSRCRLSWGTKSQGA